MRLQTLATITNHTIHIAASFKASYKQVSLTGWSFGSTDTKIPDPSPTTYQLSLFTQVSHYRHCLDNSLTGVPT